MRKWILSLPLDSRAFEPSANRRKVLRFEFVEIVASDRIEAGAFLNNVGKTVAVRDEHPLVNPVREPDEGGKLIPCQRRAVRAEFRLVGVVLAELRFKDSVHTFIDKGQSQPLAQRMRDARSRPD